MQYKIREIIPTGAIVDFADGSWAEVPMLKSDTLADFEEKLSEYALHEADENPTWAITSKGLEGNITPKKQTEIGYPRVGADPKGAPQAATGNVIKENGIVGPYAGPYGDAPDISPEQLEQYSARIDAYGKLAFQIEYITENGLEAWQKKVENIKKKFPIDSYRPKGWKDPMAKVQN